MQPGSRRERMGPRPEPEGATTMPSPSVARRPALAGLAALWLLAMPLPVRAQEINWNTCARPTTTPLQTFACNTDTGPSFDLIVSMFPFTLMQNVVGSDIRVWFRSSQVTLPSWWQIQPGGCREAAFTVDGTAPFPAGCADPWLGQATVWAEIQNPTCDPPTLII